MVGRCQYAVIGEVDSLIYNVIGPGLELVGPVSVCLDWEKHVESPEQIRP